MMVLGTSYVSLCVCEVVNYEIFIFVLFYKKIHDWLNSDGLSLSKDILFG